MQRKLLSLLAATALTLSIGLPLAGAGPVSAHQGHRACTGGADVVKGTEISNRAGHRR